MHCTAAHTVQSYLAAFSENEEMERGVYVKSSRSEWIRWNGLAFLLYRQQTVRQPHSSLALERKSKWMQSLGRGRQDNLSEPAPSASLAFTGQPGPATSSYALMQLPSSCLLK